MFIKSRKINKHRILFRRTIKSSGVIKGIGLHSGESIKLIFHPADEREGLFFIKKSKLETSVLPVDLEHVIDTSMAVTLGNNKYHIQTVEHLMYSIYVLGITDMAIEIQGSSEMPVLDGSAKPYIDFFEGLEFHEYSTEVKPIIIDKPVMVTDGNRYIVARPHNNLRISYHIDYPHPMLKKKSIELDYDEVFFKEKIASARTFGFLKEVELLKKNGLAKGGSTENALVFTGDGTLNDSRFDGEPIYHKILDLIGDLALIGRPIIGHILGSRGGHALDVAFGKKLLEAVKTKSTKKAIA
ncbi:MAG: UDP-3-O-acyl-N-acetylglucosamine deacetylase [Spirochaetia bacterium]|nr:UDP-3-O-acyl-N-acetylglucosamine deacetylase [Spirochaetia bacterium]